VIPHSNCRNFEKRFSRETDPWKNWRLLGEQLNFGAGKSSKTNLSHKANEAFCRWFPYFITQENVGGKFVLRVKFLKWPFSFKIKFL